MTGHPTGTAEPTGPGTHEGAGPRVTSGRGRSWKIRGGEVSLETPCVVGILNLTPDSFSDGGELPSVDAAIRRAERMVEEGASVLDVGGESTRPGARRVPVAEEIRRIVPTLEALGRRLDVPLSVDTRKAAVARAALDAGVSIVNDVSGLAFDPELGRVAAEAGAGMVLMHMRGTPEDMTERTTYEDLVGDVLRELAGAVERARAAGLPHEALVVDPGIGFAKTASQSLALIGQLGRLGELGLPVLVGPSRKSFLGEVLGVPPAGRATGTAVACALARLEGASLFRVHEVRPTVEALAVVEAVRAGAAAPRPRVREAWTGRRGRSERKGAS